MSTLFIRKGSFNHFGRAKAWNSTHHGRYVFQTSFFFREKYIYIFTYTYIFKYMFIYMCVYVCVFVFFLLCGAVDGGMGWCGVWCGVNGAKVAEQIV